MGKQVWPLQNSGLIRCTNYGAVLKRHLQASLLFILQNTPPLGQPSAPLCFSLPLLQTFCAEREKAGYSAQRMSDVFSELRASLMVMEFENEALDWPVQALHRFFSDYPCQSESSVVQNSPDYPLPFQLGIFEIDRLIRFANARSIFKKTLASELADAFAKRPPA